MSPSSASDRTPLQEDSFENQALWSPQEDSFENRGSTDEVREWRFGLEDRRTEGNLQSPVVLLVVVMLRRPKLQGRCE